MVPARCWRAGELGGGRGDLAHEPPAATTSSSRRLQRDERLLDVRRQAEHLVRDAQLRLLELRGRDLLAQRAREQVEHVLDERQLDVASAAPRAGSGRGPPPPGSRDARPGRGPPGRCPAPRTSPAASGSRRARPRPRTARSAARRAAGRAPRPPRPPPRACAPSARSAPAARADLLLHVHERRPRVDAGARARQQGGRCDRRLPGHRRCPSCTCGAGVGCGRGRLGARQRDAAEAEGPRPRPRRLGSRRRSAAAA